MALEPLSTALTASVMSAAGSAIAGEDGLISDVIDKSSKSILKNFMGALPALADNILAGLKIGFDKYLNESYRKCKSYKTILNPHEPIPLLENYTNVNLKCGSEIVLDDNLINKIFSLKKVIISGLAGSGKSTFMKYLVLNIFNNYYNYTPIFLELRRLNQFSGNDILKFLKEECAPKDVGVTQKQFEIALRAGSLVFVLDGYDELDHDIRKSIEEKIRSIIKDFPKAIIVISGRNDSGIMNWQGFYSYQVQPLSKDQCLNLIKSLKYDEGVKSRFYEKVHASLYDSHQSFLSYPLLVTIMLFTYEASPSLPRKMHEFYDRAFDVLFSQHDTHKEQYERKRYSPLSQSEFRICFSAFCALSYLKKDFQFTETSLNEYAQKAITYLKTKIKNTPSTATAHNFSKDLRESVCMLQQDGLDWFFVHRSFQEYFTAIFAISLPDEKIEEFFELIADRYEDDVLKLSFEIDTQSVEINYTIKIIDKFLDLHKSSGIIGLISSIIPSFDLSRNQDGIFDIRALQIGSGHDSYNNLEQLYDKNGPVLAHIFGIFDLNQETLAKLFASEDNASTIEVYVQESAPILLLDKEFVQKCESIVSIIKSMKNNILRNIKKSDAFINSIFER